MQHAVEDAHQHDDAEIGVVPAIDQERLERRFGVAFRRGEAVHDRLEHLFHALAGLGGDLQRIMRIESDHILDLLAYAIGLRRRQVDLVQDRHHLVIVVERLIDIGECLRLDALRRVDHEQRPFAGRQRTVDLIGEVDMARRVDQVQLIELPVLGAIVEAHGLRLDGDAALPLDIHGIEHLLLHLPRRKSAAELDQPVCQRRLAVIDMGDDGEVADA